MLGVKQLKESREQHTCEQHCALCRHHLQVYVSVSLSTPTWTFPYFNNGLWYPPPVRVTNVVERHFGFSTFVHTCMDDEGSLEYAQS